MPQTRSSFVSGHSEPPDSAAVKVGRARPCWPPPQSLLHFDQPDQSPTTQSTGHMTFEQDRCTCDGGQEAPYFPSGVVGSHLITGVRVISCIPGFPFESTQVDEHGPTT